MSYPLHVFLDPGHGAMNPETGQPVTPGKRAPESFGVPLIEGVFNREVCSLLEALICKEEPSWNVEYVAHSWQDTLLQERVAYANTRTQELRKEGKKVPVYVSVHGNAAGQIGLGHGLEVYTSPGETLSDTLATYLVEEWGELFPGVRLRRDYSDSDPDKEAPFYVLVNTICPAILSENFFMDTRKNYLKMLDPETHDLLALSHFHALRRFADAL